MVMIIPDLCQNGVVTKVRTTSSRDNKNTHQRIAGMPLQILIQRARSTRQICRGAYLCDLDVHVARGALPSQTFVGTQFGIPVSIIEFGVNFDKFPKSNRRFYRPLSVEICLFPAF